MGAASALTVGAWVARLGCRFCGGTALASPAMLRVGRGPPWRLAQPLRYSNVLGPMAPWGFPPLLHESQFGCSYEGFSRGFSISKKPNGMSPQAAPGELDDGKKKHGRPRKIKEQPSDVDTKKSNRKVQVEVANDSLERTFSKVEQEKPRKGTKRNQRPNNDKKISSSDQSETRIELDQPQVKKRKKQTENPQAPKELLPENSGNKTEKGVKKRVAKVKVVQDSTENPAAGRKKIAERNSIAVSFRKQLKPGEKAVVVVETLAKAKAVEKYLGDNYVVLASNGHVRNLAGRSGSVRPQDDFDLLWEVPDSAQSHINHIKAALKGANALVLASDPDMEGEAGAWHLFELLKLDGVLKSGIVVQRVTFNEITKTAVEAGMMYPRDISQKLVDACLARRALDYLIGFDISPLLWKKLPGSKTTGRVQSAALCVVCDREDEIERFASQDYWTVDMQISVNGLKKPFSARLTHYGGKKLNQFSFTSAQAKDAAKYLSSCELKVVSMKKSVVRKSPPLPYTTSSLQQDASEKLGFGATKTMALAQKLYEGVNILEDELVGLITYMRTDSQQLSKNSVDSIRSFAVERYGKNYVSEKPINVQSKGNATQAEAIRPTSVARLPSALVDVVEPEALRLYTLIWRRTVACQMEQAVYDHIVLEFQDGTGVAILNATGSSIQFPGYQTVFKDVDSLPMKDEVDDAVSQMFPSSLKVGTRIPSFKVSVKQKYTEPPLRYTEGSLVKKLEELGIGRPSTYAQILKALETRQYTSFENQKIVPQIRGRMLAAFLSRYLTEFVDYECIAKMEKQLDAVSAGNLMWKEVLRQFWPSFHEKVVSTLQVPDHQITFMLQETFAEKLLGKDGRSCPRCEKGLVVLKVNRFAAGYVFGCSRHPTCTYIAEILSDEEVEENSENKAEIDNQIETKILGEDPKTGLQVIVRPGPYGAYVQLGEEVKGKGKPKRMTLPVKMKFEDVNLDIALELLKYPVEMGEDSEGRHVVLSIGKFGYYVKVPRRIAYLPPEVRVEDLTLEKAVELIKAHMEDRRLKVKARLAVKLRKSSNVDETELAAAEA